MLNRIVKGILIATLLTFPQTNTVDGFAIGYDKDLKEKDIKAISDLQIHEDEPFGLHKGYNNLQAKIEEYKKIQEAVQIRLEEIKLREEEKKRKEDEEKLTHQRNFIVTYYGATYNECGNNHFITASGVPVEEGHIAVPRNIPFGSKIILEGKEYIATDTGNPKYICELSDGTLRVDVFVGRQYGENDYQYEKRVNNMGTKKIEGKLYLNN